jgi:cytochrome oxidase assembly protein ShyY1
VPAPPTGEVTVTGPIRQPESSADKPVRNTVRRISPGTLNLPYPVYGGYVMLNEQAPAADSRLVAVPASHENAWQNAGYVVQWWAFAAMTLYGYVYLARREARGAVPEDRAVKVPA